MRIAVISDTHRENKYISMAKELIKDADILIHLGDNTDDVKILADNFKGKIYAVAGNCDFSAKYPKEGMIEVNGIKIFYTHGDLYGVKSSLTNIYYRGRELGADIVLFGHTHIHGIERTEGMTLMNPGSISLPHFKGRYVGIIDIDNDGNVDSYLRELKIK